MKLNKTGATRWVILTKKYAIKIPSLKGYREFLTGLLANTQEVTFSKVPEFKEKLCPILFHLPFGLLVVMPKVKVCNDNDVTTEYLYDFCSVSHFRIPAESKIDSFGYYKDKLVAIDYGS